MLFQGVAARCPVGSSVFAVSNSISENKALTFIYLIGAATSKKNKTSINWKRLCSAPSLADKFIGESQMLQTISRHARQNAFSFSNLVVFHVDRVMQHLLLRGIN